MKTILTIGDAYFLVKDTDQATKIIDSLKTCHELSGAKYQSNRFTKMHYRSELSVRHVSDKSVVISNEEVDPAPPPVHPPAAPLPEPVSGADEVFTTKEI